MGIYGGGRRIITELGANEMPYGLALRHNNVYWTDWKKYVINLLTNLLKLLRSNFTIISRIKF